MIVWNDATDALLRERYVIDDASAATVAAELGEGCTASMVRSRAKRKGWAKVVLGNGPKGETAPDPTWRPPPPDAPGPLARTLMTLPAGACKWPVGGDPGDGFMHKQLFCGEPAEVECAYCTVHRGRAYK